MKAISTAAKFNIVLAAIVALAIGGVAIFLFSQRPAESDDSRSASVPSVAREDSHRLSVADDEQVVLVEFLDFECESCAAAYPYIEELRTEYSDRVTFIARYFPLDGHANSKNAAVAVEAAAQQGAFEGMYKLMYETQLEWGERQDSEAARFREYATQLGLDLALYDAAVSDPRTLDRVLSDRDDGIALGVTGTPTFFIDGKPVLLQRSYAELEEQLKKALGD